MSSCAKLNRASLANRAKTELVGMTKKEILSCAGVPVRTYEMDDLEFLTYYSGGDGTVGAIATGSSPVIGVGSAKRRYCEITLILEDGVVQSVNYTGRTGGLITEGEQCAFGLENCLSE